MGRDNDTMGELSRRSSRHPLLQDDDTNSLTSFPTPPPSAIPEQQPSGGVLHGLLDDFGPSIFDESGVIHANNPQALSASPAVVLQGVIDHYGAVFLVQRLSAALAERDAQITALRRLCEDCKVPAERIEQISSRTKQAEHRRLSLAAASEDLAVSGSTTSNSSTSNGAQSAQAGGNNTIRPSQRTVDGNGTIRNITRIFAGSGKPKWQSTATSAFIYAHLEAVPSILTAAHSSPMSSRSDSRAPPVRERPHSPDSRSLDALSIDSASWTTSLTNVISGGKRHDSRTIRAPVEMNTRFDPDQLPPTLAQRPKDRAEAEWNQFIMRLHRAREQSDIQEEEGTVIGAARFGREGTAGQKKMEALIKLVVERGVPMQMRHMIWMELSHTLTLKRPNAYQYYLNLRAQDDPAEIEAILKDVPRTLTRQYDFYVDKGYERLKRSLIAFIGKYEGLGYTQGLNMIAGHLLLAIPAEEDAFWVLCNMVDNFFPPHYFSRSAAMSGPLADNIVLRQYIRELMPQLAAHLDALDITDDHTVPLGWFLTGFADMLPISVLLRVWDVWLCLPSQQTFIFNVALTLLAQHTDEILALEETGSYYAFRYDVSEEPQKVDELIKQAFLMRKKLEQVSERRTLQMRKLRKSASTEGLYSRD